MEVITIESEAFKNIMAEITAIKAAVNQNQEKARKYIRLTTEEVSKKYDISPRTLQTWRDKKLIKFTQVGLKIWYSQADLDEFFDKYKIK